jgi:hypothetical protein
MSDPRGFLAAMRAVFWSFIGIRQRKEYENDATSLSLVHVVVAGLIGGLVFVFGVLALVRFLIWSLAQEAR